MKLSRVLVPAAALLALLLVLIMVNPTYRQIFNEVNVRLLEQAEQQGLMEVELPMGARGVVENACEVDGVLAGEVTFKINGVKWIYRCAAVEAGAEVFDLSQMEGDFALVEETDVMGCPAVVSCNDGQQGKILWNDPDSGLTYSLAMEENAAVKTLQSVANLMFSPQ